MRIGLVIAFITILFLIALNLPADLEMLLLQEVGPIEIATTAAYALALGYILYLGLYSSVKWIFWLTVLLMLRELDFDARFTDRKITSPKFFFDHEIPILQKIYGLILLAVFALVVVKVISTHAAAFLAEMKGRTGLGLAILLAFAVAGTSKLIDGAHRKLAYIGLEISQQGATAFELMEETLELGVPLLIIVAVSIYHNRLRTAHPAPGQ